MRRPNNGESEQHFTSFLACPAGNAGQQWSASHARNVLRLVRTLLWFGAIGLSVATARCAGVQARLQFHATQSSSGQWTITDPPQVAPGADPTFTQNLELALANFPAGTISTNAFAMWLAQAYWGRFGVFPATRSFPPAAENSWIVTAPQLPVHVTKLRLRVRTAAWPSDQAAPTLPWQPPATPAPNTTTAALWRNTVIEVVPTGPAGGPPPTNSPALATIASLAPKVAAQIAVRYGENQNTFRDLVYQDIQHMAVAAGLGPPYQLSIRTEPVSGDTLTVDLLGLDPIVRYVATIDQIDLPNDKGNHPTRASLVQLYGDTALTKKLLAQMDELQAQLQEVLDRRLRPEFLSGDGRAQLATALQADPAFRHMEGANPSSMSTAAEMPFPATYRPSSGSLTASLAGDSVRSLRGNASFSYSPMWIPNDSVTASLSLGTDGDGAGGHYSFPVKGTPGNLTATLDTGADYNLSRDNRLGTQSGPLVSLEDNQAGPTFTVKRSWPLTKAGAISVQDGLGVKYRDLRSTGAPTFLGGIDQLHGAFVSNTLTATLLTADVGTGQWEAGAQIQVSEWLSRPSGHLLAAQATAYVRRIFSDQNGPAFFAQLRAGAGAESSASPRITFSLLGGDTWLRGMQPGELAGRKYRVAAVEAGPSVMWLWHHVSPGTTHAAPALVRNLYLEGFAESGSVAGSSGTSFTPVTTAQSYGIGVLGLGVVPGGSITAGYGWSRQAIRPNGRFFISISVFLQP